MVKTVKPGDVVELKKTHPCGSKDWTILRSGADVKARCCGCSHEILVPRVKFLKSVRRINGEAVSEKN